MRKAVVIAIALLALLSSETRAQDQGNPVERLRRAAEERIERARRELTERIDNAFGRRTEPPAAQTTPRIEPRTPGAQQPQVGGGLRRQVDSQVDSVRDELLAEIDRALARGTTPSTNASANAQSKPWSNPLIDDLGYAMNHAGQFPTRLRERLGGDTQGVEEQVAGFLGGATLADKLLEFMEAGGEDGAAFVIEFLNPEVVKGQLDQLIRSSAANTGTSADELAAELDEGFTAEHYGDTLRTLLGGDKVDPRLFPVLEHYEANMNGLTGGVANQGSASSGSSVQNAQASASSRPWTNPLIEDLASALNNGGKFPPRLRNQFGAQADEMEQQINGFLGGTTLSNRLLEFMDAGGEDGAAFVIEFLNPDVIRGQLEQLLSQSGAFDANLQGQLDEAFKPEHYGDTLRALLGGDKVDPKLYPVLEHYGANMNGLGSADANTSSGGPWSNPLSEDLASALNNNGRFPERLSTRLGGDVAAMEEQISGFLGGGSLSDRLIEFMEAGGEDGAAFVIEFLDPETVKGQLGQLVTGGTVNDPALQAELDEAFTKEHYGDTLRLLLGGDDVDPRLFPVLEHYGANMEGLGEQLLSQSGASAAGGNDLIDGLAYALNNGGTFPTETRSVLGARADEVEQQLKDFLGDGTLADKLLPFFDMGGEDGAQFAIEFLSREVIEEQLRALLGPDVLQGDVEKQFQESMSEENYGTTLYRVLGGENMPDKFWPVIEHYGGPSRPAQSGGNSSESSSTGSGNSGPAQPVQPQGLGGVSVPPEMMLNILQETFRTGELPAMVRGMLGAQADSVQEQLGGFLGGRTLTQMLNETCYNNANATDELEKIFGKNAELHTQLLGFSGEGADARRTLDGVFTDDIPQTLEKLLGGDPVPDQVLVLYGKLETGGPGRIGMRLNFDEAAKSGYVEDVTAGGSGANAGLLAGDAIVSINGVTVDERADFARLLRGASAGDVFVFVVKRDGKEQTHYVVAHKN
ncbi:MAG: PDZ domain-containing protein [Planctomycetes bacterium]|nr:PDZ domain-containing protein [Planctomycetota bacterium]